MSLVNNLFKASKAYQRPTKIAQEGANLSIHGIRIAVQSWISKRIEASDSSMDTLERLIQEQLKGKAPEELSQTDISGIAYGWFREAIAMTDDAFDDLALAIEYARSNQG